MHIQDSNIIKILQILIGLGYKELSESSGQDEGVGRYTSALLPCINERRITTNLKTLATRLPEKQIVWKSNNQGVKEETFIQTGRRSGDRQQGQKGCMAR